MRRNRAEIDEAFVLFVETHEYALRRTAYLVCGDRHLAEDAVQSALIKVYLNWSRIEHSVAAYARKAVLSCVLDHGRRPWRREYGFDELPETAVAAETEAVGDRLLVRAALASLPPRQRAVVVLRYLDDLDISTTAAVLRCRPGTVMSAASTALAALRRFLIGHGVVRGTAREESHEQARG